MPEDTVKIDPFYPSVDRSECLFKAKDGFRDVLFILTATEVFQEFYLEYVKKAKTGEKNQKGKMLAKNGKDFHHILTATVNKTATTTPFVKGIKDLAIYPF